MNNRSPAPWPLALAVLLAAGGCDSWTAPAADSPTVTPAEYLVIMERELAEIDRKADELLELRSESKKEDYRRMLERTGADPSDPAYCCYLNPALSPKTMALSSAYMELEKEWLGACAPGNSVQSDPQHVGANWRPTYGIWYRGRRKSGQNRSAAQAPSNEKAHQRCSGTLIEAEGREGAGR